MARLGRRQPFHQRRLSSLVIGATVAYTLSCAAGAYTVTGASAGLKADRKVAAVAGAYTVTGAAASLNGGHVVSASAGAYAVTGTSAGLQEAVRVSGGAGSYVINGASATLTKDSPGSRTITASTGSYDVAGGDANLRKRHPADFSSGRLQTVPTAPIRTPVFNYQTPENDPSHYLFTRVWIAFLNAVQFICNSATYLVGSVSLTGRTETIGLTPIQVRAMVPVAGTTTKFPAGRYRVSSSLRITTEAGTSSQLGIDFGWVSGGIGQSYFGPQDTSNMSDSLNASTFMIVIDDQTEIQYTIGYISAGSPAMIYSADIAVESIAS